MDHYQTLGVARTASETDIRTAYRRLAMKWHPDRHQGDADKATAEVNFKLVQEAYRTLNEPHSRQLYDHSLNTPKNPFDYGDSMAGGFDDIMRDYMRQARDYGANDIPRGADVKWKAIVPLKTALEGGEVVYTRKVRVECPTCEGYGWFDAECEACGGTGIVGKGVARHFCSQCYGHGVVDIPCVTCDGKKKVSQSVSSRIRIPAGVVNGTEIVASKLGKPSKYWGGDPGNLQIVISIKPEGGFKFSGLHMTGTLKLPFSVALLGGTVEVQLPTGRRLAVIVPARSNAGKKIRLAECGMRDRDGRIGDVLLVVSIVLPKSRRQLNHNEEAVIRSLDQ